MTIRTTRKIVHIDEEKCNGCGACELKCVEGALKLVGGKARLISDVYCDGLGACLGECPVGAITIEDRPAEEFNAEEVDRHLHNPRQTDETTARGCPGVQVQELNGQSAIAPGVKQPSALRNWPVQLALIPPRAPFLKDADVLLAAQCSAFTYGGFHQEFIKNHALLIACPKLDDIEPHLEKLTQVVVQSGLKSLTVVRMEVPCCGGLTYLAKKAIEASGRKIPLNEISLGVNGEIKG
jgi:NAD-dependent dihydropyrimidine dehydrogenase PreA subunit